MPLLPWLVIATAATTASAMAFDSGFEIELPETIPAGPIYDEQTTVLVNAYCPGCFGDLDGDEVVTDEDFRLWVIAHMADRIEIIDVNGDGYLTATDEVESFARFLDRLSGDLNADGRVDSDDLAVFRAWYAADAEGAQIAYNPIADMNLDGVVNHDDEAALLIRLNRSNALPNRITAAVDLLANTRGTLTNGHYASGHMTRISATWPTHHSKTSRGMPEWITANHSFGLSQHWLSHDAMTSEHELDRPSHGVANSRSWAAAHLITISTQWHDQNGPHLHHYALSRLWPANHSITVSSSWNGPANPGGHGAELSYLWPPDHTLNFSQAFATRQRFDRFAELSSYEGITAEQVRGLLRLKGVWSPHLDSWSGTWPALHDTLFSEIIYPTNHMASISSSWMGHRTNLSIRWPTNHLSAVSATWPGETPEQIPLWKANHGLAISRTWSMEVSTEPEPWVELDILLGHSVYTTGMEIIRFMQGP